MLGGRTLPEAQRPTNDLSTPRSNAARPRLMFITLSTRRSLAAKVSDESTRSKYTAAAGDATVASGVTFLQPLNLLSPLNFVSDYQNH